MNAGEDTGNTFLAMILVALLLALFIPIAAYLVLPAIAAFAMQSK